MKGPRNDTCADCRKFPIRRIDAAGREKCPDYEKMQHWSDRANPCVLFLPCGQSEELARRKIVERLQAQETIK